MPHLLVDPLSRAQAIVGVASRLPAAPLFAAPQPAALLLAALMLGASLPASAQPRGADALPQGADVQPRAATAQPWGADGRIRFSQLEPMDRPVDLAVNAIFEDDIGFLWFGTEDGLFRVDGYDVRAYRPVPFDTTSIPDPSVIALAGAGPAAFWVATQVGGLVRYDAMRDAFTRFPETVPARLWDVAVDSDSVLWIATNMDGLVRFDPATGRSERFAADANAARGVDAAPNAARRLPTTRTTAVLAASDGTLWVATDDRGLCRFDRAKRTCRMYRHDPGDPTSLPSERVQSLFEDAAGTIWIGSFGGGVSRYDERSDSFDTFPIAPDARGGNVRALLALPNGVILVGLDSGLLALDPATGTRSLYSHSEANPVSIVRGSVYSLHLDRNGTVWVGTDSGVSHFPSTSPHIQHFTHEPDNPNSLDHPGVWSIHEDENGLLWVGTTIGLNRIDRRTGTVTRYAADSSDPTKLATGLVMGINRMRDGTFWVTTRHGGLQLFDRETGRVLVRYGDAPGDDPGDVPDDSLRTTTSLRSDIPWWILEDSHGRTWITSGGAGCLHQMQALGVFKALCHDPDDPNTPAHDFARQLIEADDGTLWLGTWGGGLDRIDPQTLQFEHFRHDARNLNSPPSDFVIAVREDDDGVLWLATYGAGFSRFDPATGSFTHYHVNNSRLPSDAVYEIQIDDRGRLWMSTNAGLVQFDPATESFLSFGPEDGVQDLEFNSGASYQSPSGELFFGGVNGFNAFFPEEVVPAAVEPRVVMTALQAGGEQIRPGPDSPISVALPYARQIRLHPSERDIAITFAAIHNLGTEHNRYRYRLAGYDDDWREAGDARTATYTNLGPGEHQFVVAASNADGSWTEDALVVDVIVAPRFRETMPARFLLGLFGVGLAFLFMRYRNNRLVLQHRLDLEHVEAEKLRELDRTRSVFFANVSHEFRTPLTLTIGPIDDVVEGLHGEVSERARDHLSLAKRNASRVLDLVNQILDVARLEAGQTPLRVRRLDLAAFVAESTGVFVPLAKKKAITFDVEVDGSPDDVWADPVQFEKVLSNLLSNAFKFTPGGGTIRVRVEDAGDRVRVSVRDSGPGIPASDLPFVFDRFQQAKKSPALAQPGTGIGLALAREIVQLHGGEISVASEQGFGSTFQVTLRRGRDHFQPDQIDESPVEPATGTARELPFVVVDGRGDGSGGGSGGENGHGEGAVAELNAPTLDGEDETTVLIVDDHPDVREYIHFHLKSHFRVIEASNGSDGLQIAREMLPDVIVSDVMMPGMDGFALCHAIKSDPETSFIPIVLLTGLAAHEDRMEGLREHADEYLTKPFDPEELRVRIANLIRRGEHLKKRYAESQALVHAASARAVPVTTSNIRPADDLFVERLQSVIGSRLADDGFSVEHLADEMGLSRAQLFRTVRRITDQSPSDVIRSMRLERAALMLAGRAGNVSEVAYATGFKSLSHFSRAFSQKFGCRPSRYAERQDAGAGPEH